MTEPLRILNIGGHPKDTILYAGGTMAKHAARGDSVTLLTPTTGLSHHLEAINQYRDTGQMPDMDALVEERRKELIDAAAEIGISDVRFLGHPDDIVTIDRDIVNDIADVIGETRPNIIVTHWPNDTVPAHAMATQMTLLAIDAASGMRPGRPYAPTGGDTGGAQAQIFYHTQIGRTNVLESLNIRIPTTIIDITDTFIQKSNAMNKFKSQHYGEESPLQRKLGETLDGGVYAIHMRVAYTETFIAHNPQLYDYLPLSEYGRKMADRTDDDAFKDRMKMLLID